RPRIRTDFGSVMGTNHSAKGILVTCHSSPVTFKNLSIHRTRIAYLIAVHSHSFTLISADTQYFSTAIKAVYYVASLSRCSAASRQAALAAQAILAAPTTPA